MHQTMKTKTTILCLLAAAAAVTLPSCVDASYGGGYGGGPGPGYRPGYVVQALPPSHRVEVISGTRYYYDNNVYYRSQGRGYVVVDNPHGHDRGGNRGPDRGHDWNNGPNRGGNDHGGNDRDGGRGPGRGGRNDVSVIHKLPNGYKVVNHGGKRYYQSGGSYYQDTSGGYMVVRKPF